jgi:hypothetical protein
VFRVKKVLEAFGLDVRGELEIESNDLVNLRARVQVVPEEREDPATGRRQVRMRVPYLGYARLEKNGTHTAVARDESEVDGWHKQGEPDAHAQAGDDEELAF